MKQIVNKALVALSIAVGGLALIPLDHPTQYDLKAQKEQIEDLEYELKMAKQRKTVRDCGGQDKVDFTTRYAYLLYKETRDEETDMGHMRAMNWTEFVMRNRTDTGCREYIDYIDWDEIQAQYMKNRF